MRHKKGKNQDKNKTKSEDLLWLIPAAKWIKNNSRLIKDSLKQRDVEVNRALFFDKYVMWPFDNNGNIKFKDDRNKSIAIKKPNLERFKDIALPISQKAYNFLKDRKNCHPGTVSFTLKTITRLIINHGGESVIESNIALHPYYGFPLIPGSAIKGATRHYCDEYKKLDPKEIIEVFGNEPLKSPAKEGSVVFMDAWPASFSDINSLEMDVMTPHYKDYYAGQSFPRDTIDPEPHLFLSVKKDTCFEFSTMPSSSFKGNKDELLNKTKGLIIEALSTFGIGAKTGSNYGYFK